jgi:hypothetical protein
MSTGARTGPLSGLAGPMALVWWAPLNLDFWYMREMHAWAA